MTSGGHGSRSLRISSLSHRRPTRSRTSGPLASYAIIFTQGTTNTVAQKKVKKAFEAGGCHIGAKDKHVSWKAGNGDFQTVDAHRSARCVVTILGTCVFSLESGVRCLARGHPKIR